MTRPPVAGAVLLLFALVVPVGQVAASAAPAEECYAPTTPTTTTIDVSSEFTLGSPVSFSVDVSASSEEAVTGTVAVSVNTASRAGGGEVTLHDQTHTFAGTPVVVALGEVPAGAYAIRASFTPTDACVLGPSAGVGTFVVDAPPLPPDPDTQPGPGGPGQPGGMLPDTGGPDLMWLLLALLLVAGGSGAVYWSQHRGSPYGSRHAAP